MFIDQLWISGSRCLLSMIYSPY